MKKKFITKLILSGAALAVSAATLVSTTYAWYVQNTQVTATNISGTVKDNNASSIYISKNYTLASPNAATWLPTVEFAAGDHIQAITVANSVESYHEDVFTQSYAEALVAAAGQSEKAAAEAKLLTVINKVYNGSLDPITLDNDLNNSGKFIDVNGNTEVTVTNPTDASAFVYKAAARVIEFNLYVQANVDTTIRPYLMLENTTDKDTAKSQTAFKQIKSSGVDPLVAQGGQFWIDAVQALRMQVIVEKANLEDLNDKKWDSVTTNTSNGVYDVFNIAKKDYNVNSQTPYTSYTAVTSIAGYSGATIITEADLVNEDFYVKTQDTSVVSQKQYYSDNAGTTTTATANPKAEGLYEKITLKGANAYYKALTGNIPTATFTEHETSKLSLTNINQTKLLKDKAYRFTFRIWLEGTDPACFDSCVKQTFNIGINFDVEAPQQ